MTKTMTTKKMPRMMNEGDSVYEQAAIFRAELEQRLIDLEQAQKEQTRRGRDQQPERSVLTVNLGRGSP